MSQLIGRWVLGLALLTSGLQGQEDWSRFRGPNGSGVRSANLPETWTRTDFLWSVKLPGSGTSSPVLWGNLLVVTSCHPETAELIVSALDAQTGDVRWEKTFPGTPYRLHGRNSFAASTPAIDDQRIYVAMAEPEHTRLVALDHGGEMLWQRDLGPWVSQHGFSMSPLVVGDRLVFVNSQQADQVPPGQQPGSSHVLALNAGSGEVLWQVPLKTTRACYSVPALLKTNGGTQLIGTNTGNGFYSINLENGQLNWSAAPFRMRTVASAVVADGILIGSCGSGGGGNYLVAAEATDTGVRELYTLKQSANYVPTPIVVADKLFLFGDKGIATCVDLKTGKEHWRERLARGFSGSPVSDGKRIYILDESGTVHVVAAATPFQVIHQFDLEEGSRATPAIGEDAIYFRTETQVHRLGGKRPASQ